MSYSAARDVDNEILQNLLSFYHGHKIASHGPDLAFHTIRDAFGFVLLSSELRALSSTPISPPSPLTLPIFLADLYDQIQGAFILEPLMELDAAGVTSFPLKRDGRLADRNGVSKYCGCQSLIQRLHPAILSNDFHIVNPLNSFQP